MLRNFAPWFLCAALVSPLAHSADVPAYAGRHESTPEDIAAITQVTQDFRQSLLTKDVKRLSSLMVSSSILFHSPVSPEYVQKIHDTRDVNYNGLESGYPAFAQFIATEKGKVDERFYNIKITQDRHIAFVMFDFDFRINDQIENHGVEMWQMLKAKDGNWKIASVFWSSKGAPK